MSGSRITIIKDRLGRLGFLARLALVSAVLLVAWCLLAPVANLLSGTSGIAAAAAAAGVCWIGAAAALVLAGLFPAGSMEAMGAAMLVRMLLPLALGVTLQLSSPAMAVAGMIQYLIAFYLIALAAETTLAVAQAQASGGAHSSAARHS